MSEEERAKIPEVNWACPSVLEASRVETITVQMAKEFARKELRICADFERDHPGAPYALRRYFDEESLSIKSEVVFLWATQADP